MVGDDVRTSTFSEFCQQTSLHGWHHITSVNTTKGRAVWLGIVLASLAVASVFLATATKDFATRSVVTTIETTTASLQVRLLSFFVSFAVLFHIHIYNHYLLKED